jgi:FkbM family methyltransferase
MTAGTLTKLKDTIHGRLLFFSNDLYIGRSLDLYGEFSSGETGVFEQILRPGDIAADIGANIGAHTLRFAQLVGPKGRIFAFEPQRVVFQLLCANMALNEQFNVHAVNGAAGRRAGLIRVPTHDFSAAGNFGGQSLLRAVGDELAPVTPLDQLDMPALRLLKVDVEGMEVNVLEGAQKHIARYRPFMYVENDRREKSAELITLIADMGYTMWWHLPPLFNPANFFGNPTNVFGPIVSINLLCVPQESPLVMEHFRRVSGPHDWVTNW